MTTEFTQIHYQTGTIGRLELSSDNGLNLLSQTTIQNLIEKLQMLKQQPHLRVLILSASGPKAFCAGADMHELVTLEDVASYVSLGQELTHQLAHFPVPIIAAINGYTLGAGFSLAMSCDLRVISETAKMGQVAVRNGLIPPFGNVQQILRLAGPSRGRELILTGRIISAQEALDYDLVHSICAANELSSQAWKLAECIAQSPSHAIRWAKQIVVRTLEEGEALGYALQEDALIDCLSHPESRSIMQNFLNKS